jgi:hypothetical protein
MSKEAALRQIASGYTNLESAHAYWPDLLAEVRGALVNDAVWLTDLEPLSGYVPPPSGTKIAIGKDLSGSSFIKADFAAAAYGTSSLLEAKTAESVQGKKPSGPTTQMANAIRIKGFWRETPTKSQAVVTELLKNLRDRSTSFRFKAKDAKGAEVSLTDDQIMAVTVAGKAGELGLPFQITLPLAREAAIK